MFKNGDKVVVPEPTPERVYQCALYLQTHDKGITRVEFRKAMAMPEAFDGNGESIVDTTYGVLKELDLCTESDGRIYPSETLNKIKTVDDFRRHCAGTIFREEDSIFSKVTRMYCDYADEMMKVRKWSDVNLFMGQKGLEFHDNVLKGWRLWAPFLGCGYLNDYIMIPNWGRRIADLLEVQNIFPVNTNIPLEEFMNWLMEQAPEIKGSINGHRIGLGVTNGLRTLDDLDILKIIHTPDAYLWQLAPGRPASISHVRIVR